MPRGIVGFSGGRLREAREARNLTGVSLADIAGVTPAMISQYEHGPKTPKPEVAERLARGLNFPIGFFMRPPVDEEETLLTFRSMSAATKGARIREHRRFGWLVEITDYLRRFVSFPRVTFPDWTMPDDPFQATNEDIDLLASKVRRFWGLDDEPIADMAELLEAKGAIVVRLELGAPVLDAYSGWMEGVPHVVLGSDKMSAVRSRYDAAHELGHLVMHSGVSATTLRTPSALKEIERQANFFAGAFLLPGATFAGDFGVPTLDGMLALKPRWRTSVGAMIFRAAWLSLISPDQEQRLWVAYGRRGWRRHEPFDDEIPVEEPRMLRAAFDLADQSGQFTVGGLRAALCYSDRDIEQLCGLSPGYLRNFGLDLELAEGSVDDGGGPRLINFPTR